MVAFLDGVCWSGGGAEVQKVKSVSGNLRIGPKTFCKNLEVRLELSEFLCANGFYGYLMFTKSNIF